MPEQVFQLDSSFITDHDGMMKDYADASQVME